MPCASILYRHNPPKIRNMSDNQIYKGRGLRCLTGLFQLFFWDCLNGLGCNRQGGA